MGVLVVILHFLTPVDPGEMFGWVQQVLVQMGVWPYIQMALITMVILATVSAFFRFFGR